MRKYEKWLWIELIGFDNERSDFGVSAFLNKLGFIPEVISLLIYTPNFIHTHDGMTNDRIFLPDYCSYACHPRNEERERQQWTKFQLKKLISELKSNRIKVYFSVFNCCKNLEWLKLHQELFFINKEGKQLPKGYLCPLKRLNDNTFYEDFFIEKLKQVLTDYNFDGYHGADGFAPPSVPIYEGDFSQDMIEQFIEFKKVTIPQKIYPANNLNSQQTKQISEWIWKKKRREWIDFYTKRTYRFWKKVSVALDSLGKDLVLNSVWTQDPFEAIYRYGVDYRLLEKAGIKKFIVELSGPAVEMLGCGEQYPRPFYNRMAMTLLLKAYIPKTKLIFLNGIKDTNEAWNVLAHAPTLLETEIYSEDNLFYYDPKGKLNPCVAGPLACLADGLKQSQWQLIKSMWDIGADFEPTLLESATLVCPDDIFKKQIDTYIKTRQWTIIKLLTNLIARGAPIHCVARTGQLKVVRGPLVVLNPNLFSENELKRIFAYDQGPIIFIGGKIEFPYLLDLEFEDFYRPNQLFCGVYNSEKTFPIAKLKQDISKGVENIPQDLMAINDPRYWFDGLYTRKVSNQFLTTCADIISKCSAKTIILKKSKTSKGLSKVSGSNVNFLTMRNSEKIRMLIWNDKKQYVNPVFEARTKINKIEIKTGFPCSSVEINKSQFSVKVPPQGMLVLDLLN